MFGNRWFGPVWFSPRWFGRKPPTVADPEVDQFGVDWFGDRWFGPSWFGQRWFAGGGSVVVVPGTPPTKGGLPEQYHIPFVLPERKKRKKLEPVIVLPPALTFIQPDLGQLHASIAQQIVQAMLDDEDDDDFLMLL